MQGASSIREQLDGTGNGGKSGWANSHSTYPPASGVSDLILAMTAAIKSSIAFFSTLEGQFDKGCFFSEDVMMNVIILQNIARDHYLYELLQYVKKKSLWPADFAHGFGNMMNNEYAQVSEI